MGPRIENQQGFDFRFSHVKNYIITLSFIDFRLSSVSETVADFNYISQVHMWVTQKSSMKRIGNERN